MSNFLLAVCLVTGGFPPEGGTVSGTTTDASVLEGTCAPTGAAPEHTWEWRAPRSGTAAVETCDATSSLDSVVYVLSGDCTGAEIVCNDDTAGCPNDSRTYRSSRVSWQAVAGQLYTVVVDGYDNSQPEGTYTLTLTAPGPCAPDPGFTDTPVLTWDYATVFSKPDLSGVPVIYDVAGVRLRWRLQGAPTFDRAWDEPCWFDDDGMRVCRGGVFGTPTQRYVDLEQEIAEFTATFYADDGTESGASNIVAVCAPRIWHVGLEPYPVSE